MSHTQFLYFIILIFNDFGEKKGSTQAANKQHPPPSPTSPTFSTPRVLDTICPIINIYIEGAWGVAFLQQGKKSAQRYFLGGSGT